jgi:ribosomal protein L39E
LGKFNQAFGHPVPSALLKGTPNAEVDRLIEKALKDNKPVPGWATMPKSDQPVRKPYKPYDPTDLGLSPEDAKMAKDVGFGL